MSRPSRRARTRPARWRAASWMRRSCRPPWGAAMPPTPRPPPPGTPAPPTRRRLVGAPPRKLEARAACLRAAGEEGIEKLMAEHRLDALIAPSYGPAWRIDVVTGDHGEGRVSSLPAICGYPHLTVPMGEIRRLPLGL